jgi:cell division transport system ATP-binding protein
VAFALEVQRKLSSSRIARQTSEVLERMGIAGEQHSFPRELSQGGRQRAAIARALVTEPLVLLADSVTAQLDDESAAGIFELLSSEHIRGMTILLTTSTQHFFPLFPKSSKYFGLQSGKVDEFLPGF